MQERERLEQAISALEVQRSALGDAVVETTIAALRERLFALEPANTHAERKLITVLYADLSGFTAMAETMDAEELRDTINAVWRRLDGVIANWRGRVDKHMGDGLIALFGVPVAREDDPERAVAAALAMQKALQRFNKGEAAGPQLAMRIGIHTGRVLLGPVGSGEEYTATGHAVDVAARLEAQAPVGGVLISQDVFRHVEERFTSTPGEAVRLPGRVEPLPTVLVTGAGKHRAAGPRRGVEGVETRMIGRDREMAFLRRELKEAAAGRQARAVTVVGEAGLGKSRLRHEFKQWLRRLQEEPGPALLLEGHADRQTRRLPYALIRDLLVSFSGIRDSDSPAAARAKLEEVITEALAMTARGGAGTREQVRAHAHFIGHLIGFDFSSSPYLEGILDDVRQIRQRAFSSMVAIVEALAARQPLVILLEDVHWADEGSLDFITHLLREGLEGAIFLVCLARPSLFDRQPRWHDARHSLIVHTLLELEPLSPSQGRRLVDEILRKVQHLPEALANLIVEGAGGNPYFVEEIVKVLVEDGVIEKGDSAWHVRQHHAELRVPTTLAGVLQARLDRLPPAERSVLQRAAVVGRLFWDSAVAATNGNGHNGGGLESRLAALEEKEFIFRRRDSVFGGAQEYIFKHATLREVTYESVLLRRRRRYHARVADWLVRQSGERAGEYAGLISEHYELAGDLGNASLWYARAGRQARDSFTPETAIRHYRRALDLLPEEAGDRLPRQMALYEGLGEMLRWQAHFAEAVDALESMLKVAQRLEDREAEVRAWKGLFLAHDYQGEHRAALESATGAERTARALGSDAELAMALSAKGWAMLYLGEVEQALQHGLQALRLAQAGGGPREIAYSYVLLGGANRYRQNYPAATEATEQALRLFRQLGDRIWEGLMLHNLGQTARLQGDYEAARSYYEEAVAIAQEIGDRYGAMSSLSHLGRTARLQGSYRRAETYFRDALILAERSRNLGRRAHIAHELGDLQLALALGGPPANRQERLGIARNWFEQARQLADEGGQAVTAAAAQLGLAQVLLVKGDPQAALSLAREGLDASRLQVTLWQGIAAQKVVGVAWWVLGKITAGSNKLVDLDEERVSAADCFARSMELWDQIATGVAFERARTLRDWAAHALATGDVEHGRQMQQEAAAIFRQLGMVGELARLEPERSD